jgi:hypothetical protein
MVRHALVICGVTVCVVGVLGVSTAQNPGPNSAPPNPNDVRLVGDRFKPLTYQEMTPAQKSVVDLIGVTGYYGLVSMLLNTDRYPLPAGVQPELKPLS